jgi:hypothetical protein
VSRARSALASAALAAVGCLLASSAAPVSFAATVDKKLPDLRVQRLSGFVINTTEEPGIKKLKFPAVTYNTGAGPFKINASRSSTSASDWLVRQRIQRTDGSWRSRTTPAKVYWARDGHAHWHVRNLDRYTIRSLSTRTTRLGEKHGFCFFDNTRYRDWPGNVAGSPKRPQYSTEGSPPACGAHRPNATRMIQGLSRGWGDTYDKSLLDQYIDITGLPDGAYRVRLETDWANWFQEENERNNATWADIRINGKRVTVLRRGGGV